MSHNTCLNCQAEVTCKYCSHCGQKTATQRVTMSHLIAHDVVHGAFHLDKGFFYTAKQLFTRPGHAIREYLQGKRINHFNAVTFLLLILAANIFVTAATGFDLKELYAESPARNFAGRFQDFQNENSKLLYLFSIPASSLISFLIFRKAKLNYAEHLVVNTYGQAMGMLIYTIFILLMPVFTSMESKRTFFGLSAIFSNVLYSGWLFWQFFLPYYKSKLSSGALTILLILSNMIMYSVLTIVAMVLLFKITNS